jgi:hypothetical protein
MRRKTDFVCHPPWAQNPEVGGVKHMRNATICVHRFACRLLHDGRNRDTSLKCAFPQKASANLWSPAFPRPIEVVCSGGIALQCSVTRI